MAENAEMSFWDHLDVLRGTLWRCIGAVLLVSILVFCFKSFVFDELLLAPTRSDFFLYRWLGIPFSMSLVNIELSAQFFIHLKTSLLLGFILAFPLICFEVWKFIAPALYEHEKKACKSAFFFAGILFYIGLVVGDAIILPVTLNFFQSYRVSEAVENTISLTSYISTFTSMVLLFGIVFEFPAVIAVLSRIGLVTRDMLKKYRKHAFVVILVLAAVITPADPFSMMVAALPLYLLYEGSILVCRNEVSKTDDID